MVSGSSEHALRVLEYDRMREVLASYAASVLGRRVAQALEPRTDVDTIVRELAETEEMRALLARSRLPLAGARDVASELEAVADHGRTAEPDELYHVVDLLRAGIQLRAALTSDSSLTPELARFAETIEDLPALREGIPEKIDPRDGVRDEASDRLAELRARVARLREELRTRVQRILADGKLRAAFSGGGPVLKNDRYCVPVRSEYRSWLRGPIRDRSHSGATLYVEPEDLTSRGDELVDALDRARDEEQRILRELTRDVLAERETLRVIQSRVGWIDFVYAKASYADSFGLVAPEITRQKVLDLRDARHPYLLWLSRDRTKDHRDVDIDEVRAKVVPLSLRLGEHYRLLTVTGPNTGGKTVALKTAGLSVLLALSGIPIATAAGSRVPVYEGVFADIGDEQSIEQSLSTFSSHLKQIVTILRDAGERSLVLLDELGAGTDPLEGAALGEALLDKALERGWHTIVTTHLGSLKEFAFQREGAENAAMEFDEASLRPTYRLLSGVPGRSMALAIAKRLGVDRELVAAAEKSVDAVEEPTRDVLRGMERTRRRIEREKQRTERARRRAQGERKEYEEKRRDVERERESLRREFEDQLDGTMRSARERLLALVGRMQNVPKAHRAAIDELRGAIDELLRATPLGERREDFARSLKKGDEVFVPKFRERGTVRKIDKGGRRLTVVLGEVAVEISFDDVSWVGGA